MIIKLHKSITLAAADNHRSTLDFLRYLSFNRLDGNLSIEATKATCLKILDLGDLHQDVKSVFTIEKQNVTFKKSISQLIEKKLHFYHSGYIEGEIEADEKLLDVSLLEVNDFRTLLSLPKIIFEDIENDGTVFKSILDWYRSNHAEISNTNHDFESVHGAGDRCSVVYELMPGNKKNVYAITDTDKKSPNCKLGATASKLKSSFLLDNNIQNLLILKSSELENLIPLEVYYKKARPKTQTPALDFLASSAKNNSETYFYYDFKESFNYKDVYIATDGAISIFWKPYFDGNCCGYINGQIQDALQNNKSDNKLLNKLSSVAKYCIRDLSALSPAYIDNKTLHDEWIRIGKWLFEITIVDKCLVS